MHREHGCHDCGEERIPRVVAGKLTCRECGSENIVSLGQEISGNDVADELNLLNKCRREGEDANDHNKRVYRNQRGTTKGNPYEVGSEEWKAWRDGYAYRDMVNDG